MKLYIGKEEFLKRIKVQEGRLLIESLSRKDISLSQVLFPLRPLVPASAHGSIPDRVWAILNDPIIRKGNVIDLTEEQANLCKTKIDRFVRADKPIALAFIGFPFKANLNPLKTNRHLPDLGELYFLRQLARISLTVQQVYSPGVRWIVLTEGEAYQELLDVPTEEVAAYQRTIHEFATILGMTDYVTFQSLAQLCARYDYFPEVALKLEEQLYWDYRNEPGKLPREFHTMLWTMRQSMDLRSYSAEELYYLADDEQLVEAPAAIRELWKQVTTRAALVTCRYLAFNQAKNMAATNGGSIVEEAYPEACYVSITPKLGRYAFHALSQHSRFLPHHGVPVLVGKRNGYVRIAYLVDILSKPHLYRAVYVSEDKEQLPFFYHQQQSGKANHANGGWEV